MDRDIAAVSGNVLVVDDDRTITALVKEMLNLDGYEVVEANNGLSAIESASRLHPDVILMDISMPGMDGYAAVKHLRKAPDLSDTPVIFLTAGTQGGHPGARYNDREPVWVRKPFRLAELRGVVSRALSLRHEENTL